MRPLYRTQTITDKPVIMQRRLFIKQLGSVIILSACGKKGNSAPDVIHSPVKLRFSVASDWHYGEPNTDYIKHFNNLLEGFREFNANTPSEFFVMNGDIIHNDSAYLSPAASLLKTIHPRLYVTQGNHDRVTEQVWRDTWGISFNHDVVIKDQAILMGTTSNITGAQLCPDLAWFERKLEHYKNAQNIFIFLHIYPYYEHVGCNEFKELLARYPNVRAVFNGHDHNDEGIKTMGNVPFMFDGRVGGSWGLFDRQFRVVELTEDNTLVTYLMSPWQKKKQTTLKT